MLNRVLSLYVNSQHGAVTVKSIKYFCALLFVLASNLSHASLITYGDYTLDEDTNIVTDTSTGLEWLQWDVTAGMSVAEALAEYESEGWTLASVDQISTLLNDFQLGTDLVLTAMAGSTSRYSTAYDGIDTDYTEFLEYSLFDLFGILSQTYYKGGTWNTEKSYTYATSAWFSGDNDDGTVHQIQLRMKDWFSTISSSRYDNSSTYVNTNSYTDASSNTTTGVALVRITEVSAPTTVGLFTLALMGLGIRRRLGVRYISFPA